jgi:hypothetical protein
MRSSSRRRRRAPGTGPDPDGPIFNKIGVPRATKRGIERIAKRLGLTQAETAGELVKLGEKYLLNLGGGRQGKSRVNRATAAVAA